MNPVVEQWLSLDQTELDRIYCAAEAGQLPRGDTRGTAIVAGSSQAKLLARFARLFAWQGKVFDIFGPDYKHGILINKVTPFSLSFVVAKVYKGPSWMDQRETIIIDYSTTSFFAQKIRDEIREVSPGVYLGKVWWGRHRILDFALTASESNADE
ncbi:hypothetical protein LJ739_03365 [Aestuariibacter halophilus]|uniref:Uncharacterized protein n=1 Tax=Fluctibacter halophilus TaxID=226011 RepID=A0ABS8G3W5_9ALTE|nr:hypothetical protein [Aestuariibacter halophilus]MCC2615277.1 hypothetical protein [Aestuariibacter halophilus]